MEKKLTVMEVYGFISERVNKLADTQNYNPKEQEFTSEDLKLELNWVRGLLERTEEINPSK